MSKFQTVPGPFGTMMDEQATTDAFVEYVGGRTRADQLFRIYQNSYPNNFGWNKKSKADVFRIRAKAEGFTNGEVDALLLIL